MGILKGIIAFVLIIVLAACLIAFPFIYATDRVFLSESFYSETLEDLGVYTTGYDVLMRRAEANAVQVTQDKGLPPETARWMMDNVKTVLDEAYVTQLIRDVTAGMVSYLTGETKELPEFDLTPKYEELKRVTAENIDLNTVMMFLGTSEDSAAAAMLELIGLADEDGTMNPLVTKQVVDFIFNNNEQITEIFEISNPVEAMTFVGMANAQKSVDTLRAYMTFFHRNVMVLLLLISFITGLLILMWLRKIRVPFLICGGVYTITSVITFLSGMLLATSERIYMFFIARFAPINPVLIRRLNIPEMVKLYGKNVLSVALIFLFAGIVFYILAAIFKRRKPGELTP